VNTTDFPGKSQQFIRPLDHNNMKAWVHRSFRAHPNGLEQLVPFAAIVLGATVSHVSDPVTIMCFSAFFWLRVTHAAGVISGLARFPLRPMICAAGWVLMLVLIRQIPVRAA
jgi:uncharacterized MAPEG superfamily protein